MRRLEKIERQSTLGFQQQKYLWSGTLMKLINKSKIDKAMIDKLRNANESYTNGNYFNSLTLYNKVSNQFPVLNESLFYYMRCCDRVKSIPLLDKELQIDKLLKHLDYDLEKLSQELETFIIRCKWCGRYTEYIDPDEPTFGLMTYSNSCQYCNRMYPTPSLVWDSPDGRAYSYFRGSFIEDDFYFEFEEDYEPIPRKQR